MSYKSYKAGVERRRALLRDELEKANDLRTAAQLPTRDIDQVVAEREPLLTQDAWSSKRADQRAFARFRREHVDKPTIPRELQHGMDWQATRALACRRAFLHHQIQQAWLAQAEG